MWTIPIIRQLVELRRILNNRKLSRAELEAERERRLRKVILNAYEHVPYYRSLFESAGISPEDIETVDDLTKVPMTTKDDVRAGGTQGMIADWARVPSLVSKRTSGSTGEPLTVYRSVPEQTTGLMLHFASLIAIGLRPSDRFAAFGPIQPVPTWLHRYVGMFKSEVILRKLPMEEQVEKLKEFRPTVIHTNPSVLRSLINNLSYPVREVIQPRIVILGGETIDEGLKTQFQAELDAEFFNIYGAIEFGRLAWECPTHEGLHFNADHFILELLEGEDSSQAGGAPVAVVTSLYAFAMPFIRYRLGDLCSPVQRECSCGSPLPLIHYPLGREEDIVRLPSGKILSPRRLDHILRAFSNVLKWQVVQQTLDHFIVKLVLDGRPDDEMLHRIRSGFNEYFQEPVSIDIQSVDFIEEGAPKARTFTSRVPASVGE
ncbi:MAG: AMP-binding protein [Deltaproteobacteria bacterium]